MTLGIIAAVGSDRAIGRNGDLVFFIKDDLRRFKQLTMGYPIIMGRKTFESLPKGALPGRRNIVVTRNPAFEAKGTEIAKSVEEAVAMAAGSEKAFIIGGASVYEQALPLAHELLLTLVDAPCSDADTFFPAWEGGDWVEADPGEPATDPSTGLSYRFARFIRKI